MRSWRKCQLTLWPKDERTTASKRAQIENGAGWPPQSATPRGIQKGLASFLTVKRKKKMRQSGLYLFSIVMPKDYSNSAILFQKDCLAAFHTVGETAGSKQYSVLSASAVPPLPESQFAPMACQAFPAPDEGGSSGREELAVLSRGSSLSPR